MVPQPDASKTYEIRAFVPEEIGAVYLGCKMTRADKVELIKIIKAKYPIAEVFEATKSEHEFALDFVRRI